MSDEAVNQTLPATGAGDNSTAGGAPDSTATNPTNTTGQAGDAGTGATSAEEFYEIRIPGKEPIKMGKAEFDELNDAYSMRHVSSAFRAAQGGDGEALNAIKKALKLDIAEAKADGDKQQLSEAQQALKEVNELKKQLEESRKASQQAELTSELDRVYGEHFSDYSDENFSKAVKYLAAGINANGDKAGVAKATKFVKDLLDGYAKRDKQNYVESKLKNGARNIQGAGGVTGGKQGKSFLDASDYGELGDMIASEFSQRK